MFYYQQFFRTALDGIDRSNIMVVTVQVGQVILLVSFLVAVYESFIRGADVRMLGVAAVKYVALGLVLLGYATVFRDVNTTLIPSRISSPPTRRAAPIFSESGCPTSRLHSTRSGLKSYLN